MTSLQSTSPASLRSGSPSAREQHGSPVPDQRPYLLTGQRRKSAVSVQQYLALFPHEAEDARLTGSTRSLFRRLLALNLPDEAAAGAVTSPGPHGEVITGLFGRTRSKIA